MTGVERVRLGAVGYLNARPLVYELGSAPAFDLRFDVPSECARLLHAGKTDLGLIPSIEYLRGGPYRIVPDLAIVSDGPVDSVALYTRKPMREVRSIALDTSSRTSVALVSVLCRRHFRIAPALHDQGPDLAAMLARADAALLIGDVALLLDERYEVRSTKYGAEKIDLGEVWKEMTGLPFVYAFWAGKADALRSEQVDALQRARDAGVRHSGEIAREYFPGSAERQAIGERYLRDNIRYYLRDAERAGLEAFYRYAAEAGLVPGARPLDFF